MAYVAVKGGERAIDNAHAWLAEERRGDPLQYGAREELEMQKPLRHRYNFIVRLDLNS